MVTHMQVKQLIKLTLVLKKKLTMTTFSHIIHHVFWSFLENNTNLHIFYKFANL